MTTRTPPRTKRETKPEEAVNTAVPTIQMDEQSVFEIFMDHQRKAFNESGQAIESLLPVAFKEHSKTALKETVEGYRTLVNTVIDDVIERIEKLRQVEEKEEPPVPQP